MRVPTDQLIAFLLLAAAACCAPARAAPPASPVVQGADVRVLIDISGSMKQTDPQNLRRAALRLLVGLLTPDTRAGVWTFAQQPGLLVPLGRVDPSWQEQARRLAEQIASPGKLTDIARALNAATADWKGRGTDRHVVLLTDGMVDLGPDAAVNAVSRDRILGEVKQRLTGAGARVHTIALSAEADHALLRALAVGTSGWHEQVDSAEQLQRVFLRIFQKVARPDTVPFEGNRFRIDASVREATVLVFRDAAGQPPRFVTPASQEFGADDAPPGVRWHADQGFDLVTIARPEPGEWGVTGEGDPDNRVMVVTDLKMRVSDVPDRVVLGESLPLSVSFVSEGVQVTRRSFLERLRVYAGWADGSSPMQPLNDRGDGGDAVADDARLDVTVVAGPAAGRAQLRVLADGLSFVRDRTVDLEMLTPGTLAVTPADAGAEVVVVVQPDLVDADGTEAEAWVESRGKRRLLSLQRVAASRWETKVDDLGAVDAIHAAIRGKTRAGRTFEYQPPSLSATGGAPVSVREAPPEQGPDPDPRLPAVAAPPVTQEPPEPTDWVAVAMVLGSANGVLIVAGLFAHRRSRRRGRAALVLDPALPEGDPA